jgi:integrase
MKIRFNLARKHADISFILFSASWNGNRIQSSIGESVPPKDWDIEKGKARRSFPHASELNHYLDRMKSSIEAFYYEQKAADKIPSKKELQQFIKNGFKKPQARKRKKKALLDYYQLFIQERKKSGAYKETTIKRYRTSYNHIVEYQKYDRVKLTFDDINKDFYINFSAYLNDVKNLANNSAGNVFKFIKTFMNWALEKKLHTNTEYIKAIKVIKKDADPVFLTDKEIELLTNVKLDNPRLEKTRDLFLIQYYTLLRYSDLEKLSPENFDTEGDMIKIETIKTEQPILIPFHKKLKELVEKYPDYQLPIITNQRYNDYLKEVCRIAGIDAPVERIKYYGKRREKKVFPKYEIISSHSARHTGITYLLRKGLLPEYVMKISGHRSRAAFQRYVNIAQNEAVEEVRKVWEG